MHGLGNVVSGNSAGSHSLEAALDFRFIHDRFIRGKDSVKTFLTNKQGAICEDTLMAAHAQIVAKQASMGPNALPELKHS